VTRLVLPWPPRELHPNARVHHMARAKAARAYREQCMWIAKAGELLAPAGEIMLAVEFFPPDRRRRDLDGMFSNIKAGIDGIADAMEVDDYRFAFTIHRRSHSKNGAVFITVQEAA
jgi:crossover junction endodeoxyribonuclease RusA